MPRKHPNAYRWGGPGASHEDRCKPMPPPEHPRPAGASTSAPVSRVSGGGGERDRKHSHIDNVRSSKRANMAFNTKPNRPRRKSSLKST
jgi:hypothetical protein